MPETKKFISCPECGELIVSFDPDDKEEKAEAERDLEDHFKKCWDGDIGDNWY